MAASLALNRPPAASFLPPSAVWPSSMSGLGVTLLALLSFMRWLLSAFGTADTRRLPAALACEALREAGSGFRRHRIRIRARARRKTRQRPDSRSQTGTETA
jgi:hypothetical protein